MLVTSVLALAVLAVFLLALSMGDYPIGVPDVLGALTGQGSVATHYVVVRLRLPRALLGLLVGVAFGLAGVIFQRLLRNPLASPDVIGLSAGSCVGAVICLLVFGASGLVLPASALAGGLLTGVLIYLLAWRRGVTGYRFVLTGVVVSSALMGVVSYVMTRADVRLASVMLLWLSGSLNGADWADVRTLGVFLVVLVPLALLLGRMLPVLQLGNDHAAGLGLRVERSRLALLAVAVGLTAVATAVCGPVAFVAFVSGPIASRLLRTGRPGLLAAALVGALVTLVADFVAQHLLGGTKLPVGVVTGAVGSPYLLYLMATANRGART
ncbi:FecCD family ABC transporter permease [Amycolatopsis acididurans]|uniref:FecCD family ABC transporter permease n=1 Tax=Amycolatopsis acididurans TaxID=2724524 RepID=UPI0028AE0E25|nr:iron chelate uptake ABC transporter family permease subunit [Amycolatopsis acididurans]